MNLVHSMREEYGHSKKWFKRTHIANVFLLILAVAMLLFGDHIAFGILALLAPLFIMWARFQYTHHYDIAERMRRLLLLMDSLGMAPSQAETAQFGAEIGRGRVNTLDFVAPYYNSPRPMGLNRLADNIAESSYFTKYLSRSAAGVFAAVSCLGILMIVLLLTTTSWLSIQNRDVVSRILITIAVFFSTGDFSWIAIQFCRLHSAADNVLTKAEPMREERNIKAEEVYRVMQDYNCAVIQVPPIPELFYKKWIKKLNESWRQAESERSIAKD